MIRREKHITRAMLRAEPETLFVFGDNLERRGLGGQAAEMRGEPNAVGIPTKRAPSMREDAFFTDADLTSFINASYRDAQRLAKHVDQGGTVVLPADGIGTGLADLQRRAPEIWEVIQGIIETLEVKA
jgi:hypothetical protein